MRSSDEAWVLLMGGHRVSMLSRDEAWVLWIGPGHRVHTCVSMPKRWVEAYRRRVVREWDGRIVAVYRSKLPRSAARQG